MTPTTRRRFIGHLIAIAASPVLFIGRSQEQTIDELAELPLLEQLARFKAMGLTHYLEVRMIKTDIPGGWKITHKVAEVPIEQHPYFKKS